MNNIVKYRREYIRRNGLTVGTRARFYHPMTGNMMYYGRIIKIKDNGWIEVLFDCDDSLYSTFPYFVGREVEKS